MSKPPSGGPKRSRGARAASTSRPTPATASSAASTRARHRPPHRAHHATRSSRICGGEAGPMDDQTRTCPKRKPVALRVERAAKRHRHAGDAGATAKACSSAWGSSLTDRARAMITVVARRALPLRHPDRGRPDRGSHPPAGLSTKLPTTAPLAPSGRQGGLGIAPRSRFARAPRDGRRWATRRRSTSASSRRAGSSDLAGNANPIQLLNPIAAPAERDALPR